MKKIMDNDSDTLSSSAEDFSDAISEEELSESELYKDKTLIVSPCVD